MLNSIDPPLPRRYALALAVRREEPDTRSSQRNVSDLRLGPFRRIVAGPHFDHVLAAAAAAAAAVLQVIARRLPAAGLVAHQTAHEPGRRVDDVHDADAAVGRRVRHVAVMARADHRRQPGRAAGLCPGRVAVHRHLGHHDARYVQETLPRRTELRKTIIDQSRCRSHTSGGIVSSYRP